MVSARRHEQDTSERDVASSEPNRERYNVHYLNMLGNLRAPCTMYSAQPSFVRRIR